MNSGHSIPQLNGFTVKRKEKKLLSLKFVFSEALLMHKTPRQLLQETGNYYAHHFSSLLAICRNRSRPFSLSNHICLLLYLRRSVRALTKINAATTAPQLIFLYAALLYFPIIVSGGDKCLSPPLSWFLKFWSSRNSFFYWVNFLYCCISFTLLWIRRSVCTCQHFSESGPQAWFIAFCRLDF